MMKKLIVLLSIIVAASIIVIATSSQKKDSAIIVKSITVVNVQTADGKEGRPCYVILSGVVYEIKQGNKWKDGEHTPSEGQAYCGQDVTEIITKSPHGKSIISLLTEIGPLKN